jgi:hypothetical protein
VGKAPIDDLLAEVWRDAVLRRGCPDTAFTEMVLGAAVEFETGGGPRLTEIQFTGRGARGEEIRRTESIDVFRDLALATAGDLIREGVLPEGAELHYEVLARTAEPAAPRQLVPWPPPAYLTVPLPPLLAAARVAGDLIAEAFPVLYTEEALARSERFARQGAGAHPPLETGAALVGYSCSCPESGEFYLVITDALEATDADRGEFSLSYTGKTWARIQAVLQARQRRPGARALRLTGQGHGHNFPPEGGAPPCAACARERVCRRTNVFMSLADRTWARAVFHGQPWQVSHIFGLNGRRERVQGLFTLLGNRFVERGFHVIPDFAPRAAEREATP